MRKLACKLSVFILLSLSACLQGVSSINLAIVDESGSAVEDAFVELFFVSGNDTRTVKKMSDNKGRVSATKAATIQIRIRANKVGYYQTQVDFNKGDHNTKLVLKKKKNPIPMYVKNTHLLDGLPEDEIFPNWIGYDFEIGDHLPPYGTGVRKDFEFVYVDKRQDMWNYSEELVIRFPNQDDGLVVMKDIDFFSEYWSGYEAPLTQYENYKVFYANRQGVGTPRDTNFERSRKYYFRVRSQVDEEGNLISAHYGKLYDELGALFYYFNPNENDRNLEFKVGSNLFGEDVDPNKRIFKP